MKQRQPRDFPALPVSSVAKKQHRDDHDPEVTESRLTRHRRQSVIDGTA